MPAGAQTIALDPLEPEVQAIGRELHERLGRRFRGPAARLDNAMLEMTGGDSETRAALLRFVDVYPACRGARDVAGHLVEHLAAVRGGPASVRSVVRLARTPVRRGLALPAAVGVRRMARRFIIGADASAALPYLERLWQRGVAASVDLLGEMTVTEEEADRYAARCADTLEMLADAARAWPANAILDRDGAGALPRANLSVKVSALTPRLHRAAPEVGAEDAARRLRPLLRLAREAGAHLHLDMEQLDTRETTLECALGLLAEPEFAEGPSAGVVLQAYLVDSQDGLEELLGWADGHARAVPLTIRLVKGAYWDHEVATARQNGWEPPVWTRKEECDASFERLTRRLLAARPAIRVAIASHNLRSLAQAIATSRSLGAADSELELQVLHGLGDTIADAAAGMGLRVRAYSPVGDLVSGMGYLVRRLLENSSNQSFLHHQAEGAPVDELLAPPTTGAAA